MKQILIGLTAFLIVAGVSQPLAQSTQAPPVPPAQSGQGAQTTQATAATAPAAADPAAAELARGQIIQRILVKVNGEILTQTDLEERQIQALQDRNRNVSNPQDLRNDAALRALLVEITPKILVDAIDELILLQRARELGYKVTEAQYKDMIDGIKKDNKVDDAQLMKLLQQQGMTMEQLRQQMERSALMSMLTSQEIMSHVAMTEEEARQYYTKHQSEFLSPPAITLREILVTAVPSTPSGFGSSAGLNFSGSSDATAQAKIQAALDRLRKGEDFAAVAAEVSDAPSKARGGLMTPVGIDDLSQAIRDATEKLKPGDITSPIKTARGYQLFKVEARTAQAVLPFDQVHQAIMQKVFDQRRGGETKKYVERLRAQALIEWKDEDLKKLYESRVNAK
jgi:parvulin-like peptidyl-prolyl isomerase